MGCWRRSSRTFSLQSLGPLVFRSTRFNDDDTHQSFESSMSSELDQIQSSFLMISSELQNRGNLRPSLRTSGRQTSLALGSSESSSLECWRRSTDLLVFSLLQ